MRGLAVLRTLDPVVQQTLAPAVLATPDPVGHAIPVRGAGGTVLPFVGD